MKTNHNQRQLFDDVSFSCSKSVTLAYSTSFSSGIKLLNARFRNPIYGIYGFVRLADEIVDTFHEHNKVDLLARFRFDTIQAINDRVSLNPILNAFQAIYHRFDLDMELVDKFLLSMEMDLSQTAYDRAGYENYIYGSAEVVGLMCLKVFTERDHEMYLRLKPSAMSLGAAFQKINFLRDVKDDHDGLGRMYFPNLDFNNFSEIEKKEIEKEIENDFRHAYEGIVKLPKDARLGVLVAYVYYRHLFLKIQLLPSHRVKEQRIRIPNGKKMALVMSCYVRNNLNLI